MYRETLEFETPGKGCHEITRELHAVIDRAGIDEGVCHVFMRHTSASLVISENADPSARRDLEEERARDAEKTSNAVAAAASAVAVASSSSASTPTRTA